MSPTALIQSLSYRAGFQLQRGGRLGVRLLRFDRPIKGANSYDDVRTLIKAPQPVCFDIGANAGQTARKLAAKLPGCAIHSFEPSPRTFAKLEQNVGRMPGVRLINAGVGSAPGVLTLHESSDSELTSFMEAGAWRDGFTFTSVDVPVVTLDDYCREQGIGYVHLLKTDTQGYDLEVLKGAQALVQEGRVGLLLMEIAFRPLYAGAPAAHEALRFVAEAGFELASFYDLHRHESRAIEANALFIHRSFGQSQHSA